MQFNSPWAEYPYEKRFPCINSDMSIKWSIHANKIGKKLKPINPYFTCFTKSFHLFSGIYTIPLFSPLRNVISVKICLTPWCICNLCWFSSLTRIVTREETKKINVCEAELNKREQTNKQIWKITFAKLNFRCHHHRCRCSQKSSICNCCRGIRREFNGMKGYFEILTKIKWRGK